MNDNNLNPDYKWHLKHFDLLVRLQQYFYMEFASLS